MSKTSAVVIGLGRMGAEPSQRLEGKIPAGWLPISHAEAIVSNPKLELVALCDVDEARRSRFAQLYNVEKTYANYQELLTEIKPGFVCIATRTEGRTDIIKSSIDNGAKAIYLEKPISRSIAEAQNIIEYAAQNKVLLGYGVNRRYHATYLRAKEIIDSGELGEIVEIIVEHDRAQLFWTHPHSVDIIQFFAATTDLDFVQATCEFSNGYLPTDNLLIDDDPTILNAFFRFNNGIQASITCGKGLNTRIACTKGVLTVLGDGYSIEINKESNIMPYYYTETRAEIVDAAQSATQNVISQLAMGLETGEFNAITPAEIVGNMAMLSGIVYSHIMGGKRIQADQIPADMVITGKSGNFYA